MICYIDGGYDNINKRNPYCSVKIYDDLGEVVYWLKKMVIPATTSNQAEYMALIKCLDYLDNYGDGSEYKIYSDSKLLVEQVGINWQVKDPHLQYLWKQVYLHKSEFDLTWVPRETMVKELGH